MKDMKIPLDIVWLDAGQEVIYMVLSADPELATTKTFVPTSPARYVVELPAGAVRNAGIKIGTEFIFNLKGEAK